MQKNAWTYSLGALVLGALGLMLHWLQLQTIFPDETGLPVAGAGISYLMVLALALMFGALWWLSTRLHPPATQPEPEEALASPYALIQALMVLAGLLCFGGGGLLFFKATDTLLRVTALLALLAAPALLLYPLLPRWGGMGAFLAVLPVAFFCLWLVTTYKENVANPVLWQYAVQVLAVAAELYAAYQLCGYLFYRARPKRAVFACMLATAFGLTALADEAMLALKLLHGGWALGCCALCWAMVYNIPAPRPDPNDEDY